MPVSVFTNLLTGIYYLMFSVFPGKLFGTVMSPFRLTWVLDVFTGIYGFSVGTGGLAYIGLGVGFVSATLASVYLSDGVYSRVRAPFFKSLLVCLLINSSHSWLRNMGRASRSSVSRYSYSAPSSSPSACCEFTLMTFTQTAS